ncbi:MAG: asparaginase, partial [Actinomycetota bacterium]|nr:asparaginase [Actinomycetota bacterium]
MWLAQNCSGKHSAMLATCVAVVATTGELTGDGEPAGVTV